MTLRLRVRQNHLKQLATLAAVVLLLISLVFMFTGCLRQSGSIGPADKSGTPGVGAASQTSRPETAGPSAPDPSNADKSGTPGVGAASQTSLPETAGTLMPDLPNIDPGGFELPYEEPAEPVSGGLSNIMPDVSPVTVSP